MKNILLIISLLFTFTLAYPQSDSLYFTRQIQAQNLKIDSLQKRIDSLVRNSASISQASLKLQEQQNAFNTTSSASFTVLSIITALIGLIVGVSAVIIFFAGYKPFEREVAEARKLNEEMNSKLEERFKKFQLEQEAKAKEAKQKEINEAVSFLLSNDSEKQWDGFTILKANRNYTYDADQLTIMVEFYKKVINDETFLATKNRYEEVTRFFENLVKDIRDERLINYLFSYYYEYKATGKKDDPFILTFVNNYLNWHANEKWVKLRNEVNKEPPH